ncbi:MAG: hypothetical protein J0H08_14685 [Rhizobiales bacterium]|nr:hypothetical protein [Hyphomicrobiales bacterium]
MTDVLVDNDIVLKSCCYCIDEPLFELLDDVGATPLILTVAKFVIAGRIKRDRSLVNRERAHASFKRSFVRFREVEPTEEELALAAEFEATAQALNLELDGGESQLLALLIKRRISLLLTGDKRAIVAIERVAAEMLLGPSIICLEQVMTTLLGRVGLARLREGVCTEPDVDRAMTICFACRSTVVDQTSVEVGLRSYVDDLRKSSSRILIEADDLSVLIS